MSAVHEFLDGTLNPLDRVEDVAAVNEWHLERTADDEVNIIVAGTWSDIHVCLNWRDDLEGLHLACTFDLKVPPARREEVARLVTLINAQLYFGHFDIWRRDGVLVFRDGLILSGGVEISDQQCETLIRMALQSCERYFPAFQFVIWAGKPAEEALTSAIMETAGEA